MNSKPRRRVRRRSTDNDNDAVLDFLRRSSTQSSPTPQDTEPKPEVISSPPPAIRLRLAEGIATLPPPTQIVNDELDPIRTELLNDFHHQNFSESDYWDESHNWSDDEDSVSDEYWYFLGQYE
jgi:hypothetical protein